MTSIEVKIETGPAAEALERAAQVLSDDQPLLRAIGTGLVEVTRDRFASGTDPQGQPWAPLNPLYAATKRGPGILRESAMRGGLMASVTFDTAPGQLRVGTNKIYAGVHQFGGTILPKAKRALAFRIGGEFIVARSVTIPARPFLGIGPEDEDMILDVTEGVIERALDSGSATR